MLFLKIKNIFLLSVVFLTSCSTTKLVDSFDLTRLGDAGRYGSLSGKHLGEIM